MANNGNAKSDSRAYTINQENFSKRLKVFYDHWKENECDLWGSSDAITIATPPPEDLRFLKSSALDIWLLGYVFPVTIIVFIHKQIHFLCSQKKANLIKTLKKAANEAVGADIVLHVKAKNEDGIDLMDDILQAVRAQSESDTPVVGHIAREAPVGKLLETWADKLSAVQLTDVTDGFSELFSVKDTTGITCAKKSAYLTSSVMKNFVVPKLERIIGEERKISHSSLMSDTEKAILNPLKIRVKLKAENVDICYPPVFQCGGKFDLKSGASSNDDDLYYDSASVIICAIGSRYSSYCSNIARTFLIDATPTQSNAYETLLKAHEAAIAALKPGNQMSAVYQAAVAVIENNAPELLANLTKSAGTGMGLEFRESGLNLNFKNDRLIKESMIFNVSLGLHNVQAETNNKKTKQFTLLLADTVLMSNKGPKILTAPCSKAFKHVAYSFNEGEEDVSQPKVVPNGKEVAPSNVTLRSDNQEMSKEELLRQMASNRMKSMRLNDVWIRPAFGGCGIKLTGTLEANFNGFKYSTSRADKCVDIMYRNIKHAFFQPAEKEMIILLHFHLHNHIMVGNKKTKDVQFFVDVMDDETLGRSRRSALGPDEIEEEQRERDLKNRINIEFQNYVNMINDHWSQTQFKGLDLEFDIPIREFGFHGVPYKASAFIIPTSTCLVELIGTPFLVVTLSEIEIVNLERVGVGTNFDMAIVFKDFKKDIICIGSIPSTSLDAIKEWLDTTDLTYYESSSNLNWHGVLKTVIDDPQNFIDDYGWTFLSMDVSDSETEQIHESDQGYEPSDSEPESERESLVESDEDGDEDSEEDSKEEKGKTWEELELEASNAVRENGAESDSEEERRCRKVKTFSKSRPPPVRSSFKGGPSKKPKFR